MGTFRQAALAVGLLLAVAPAAMAQSQPELRIAARTDSGGASPACMIDCSKSLVMAYVDPPEIAVAAAARMNVPESVMLALAPEEASEIAPESSAFLASRSRA